MTTRAANGVEIYFEATGILTYAFDEVLTKPAKFKLITSVPAGDLSVKFADGSTATIDVDRLDSMNAQLLCVYSAGAGILITDFGLFV